MCVCVEQMNAMLANHGAAIVEHERTGQTYVETVDLKSLSGDKAPKVLASYCPFCGTWYGWEEKA